MRRLVLALPIVVLSIGGGCQPDSASKDSGVQADTGADAPIPDGTDGGDAGECAFQSDCADAEMCIDSVCRTAPKCSGPDDWPDCVAAVNELQEGLGKRAFCSDGRCQIGCMLDRDCPDGQICTDFGRCEPFEGSLDAPPPGGDAREKLRAGIGASLMQFPIGLSLGGYGSRMAADDGRYVESLRATHGQMHGLHARAIALDNGARKLLLIRLPIIFTTAALHEAVARRLQKTTGANWRGSLLISSTHTHSGPARFFHLPRETFLPLGRLGTDEFHDQVFRWLVDDATRAAQQALQQMQPAQFGSKIVEGFDPDDAIARDRRGETPPFDDNRLLLLRIDDTSGSPLAVAVSFGIHGTIHSGDYFNGDAIGGIEHGLERALAQKYGRTVPVLFFNQNGGTMSPGGDGLGHDEPQRFQKLGRDFANLALPEVDSIETSRSIPLDGVTYRYPISYDLLGYSPGEWGGPALDSTDQSYYHGALRCPGDGDDDFTTFASPDDLSCAPVHKLLYHRPPTLFLRTQSSAFRLGSTTIVTVPGELSMELGWEIQHRLQEEFGLDPADSWTLGFAQDHEFYLLPDRMTSENVSLPGFRGTTPRDAPDRAFSYLQGGYEANMTFWGWKFGDYLVERSVDAVARLEGNDVDRKLPKTLPAQFSPYGQSDFPSQTSDPSVVGTVVDQPPKRVERFEPVEFAWKGGDPGAERPQSPRVALQRQSQRNFQTVETDRKRPYSNREPVMLTRLRQKDGSWVWVVRWEELEDFPTGTYRFAVQGTFLGSSGPKSYTTHSRSFDVRASDDLAVDTSIANGQIEGTIGYPAGEPLQFEGPSEDPGAVRGNFRLRDPRVPTDAPAPLAVGGELSAADVTIEFRHSGSTAEIVTGADVTLQVTSRKRAGHADVPTTVFSAAVPSSLSTGTTYQVEVRAEDAYRNTGTQSFTHQVAN